MHFALTQLFCRHAAISFGKQLHLSDLIGDSNWHFDMASGQLSFNNNNYHWHVQLLGTEAYDSQTWLWSWANEASRIPPHLLGAALTLRMLGQHHGVPELTEPKFPLGEIDGHVLGMIASGVCRADAYYRCPYEGGAAFLLIKDDSFPGNPEPSVLRLATVFPQALAALSIDDHRAAWLDCLHYYGLTPQVEGPIVRVEEGGQPVLTATFDAHNRLIHLDSVLRPPPSQETPR